MRLVRVVKVVTGTGIAIAGFAFWLPAAMFCIAWTLYVLYPMYGTWVVVAGVLLAPVTYLGSVVFVSIATGMLPPLLMAAYLASWTGIILIGSGERMRLHDVHSAEAPPPVDQA